MKPIVILLLLAFLTGFQAAVLNEEPPPSISEPKQQSFLEQLHSQFGQLSTQVTETINDGLGTMKERLSDAVTYIADTGKKHIPSKIYSRKLIHLVRDAHQYGQHILNQGKEMVKNQMQKAVSVMDEIKQNPTVITLHEGYFKPAIDTSNKYMTALGEQSLASVSNMLQKNMKP